LRALSVIVVILFHLDVSWLPGGFVGVDVFFVISGYLITSLISKRIAAGTFSLIDFYERRFRRIYPNLIIVIVATMVIGWFTLMPEPYRFFGRTAVWAALSASNFAFMTGGGYFDPGSITKPLLHTWSLGVEEQFYLLFPWVLILAARRGWLQAAPIAVLVALSLALSIAAAWGGWANAYFLLPTRFWELGLGALIAVVPVDGHLTTARRTILGGLGLAAILWAAICLSESDSFPGYVALAPTLGAAMLIVANGGVVNRFLSLPPFTLIGRLSFALYLWHWPLISIAAGIGFLPTETGTRLFVATTSLLLSFIGYHAWEVPIRQHRLLVTRRRLFAALVVSVACIAGPGITIFSARGLPRRLPTELTELAETGPNGSRLIRNTCAAANSDQPYACPIGDLTAPHVSFVILGDSHSEAVAAEIGDIAGKYGLRGLYMGKGGCRSFVEPPTEKTAPCVRQNDFAVATYLAEKPELVLVIARWTAALNGETGNETTDQTYRAISSTFGRTLDFYRNSRVVTALTVPEYDIDAPTARWNALIRQQIGLTPQPMPTISLDAYWKRQKTTASMLEEVAHAHDNLRIVDPTVALCPHAVCTSSSGGKLLYLDDDHLSHAGALLYAPLFEPYLADLASRSPLARAH
jgi:peptidoglycan/LPS O-acetylase OafA/YrhL